MFNKKKKKTPEAAVVRMLKSTSSPIPPLPLLPPMPKMTLSTSAATPGGVTPAASRLALNLGGIQLSGISAGHDEIELVWDITLDTEQFEFRVVFYPAGDIDVYVDGQLAEIRNNPSRIQDEYERIRRKIADQGGIF